MTGATTHILRVSLKPRLYRDVEIEDKSSLYALAEAITNAFEFDFDHAFGFFSRLTGKVYESPVRYELFADPGARGKSHSVRGITVARAFPRVGSKMLFLFDYGDEWRFQVEVISLGRAVPDGFYPRVIATAGKAPSQYSIPDDEA
jgi:hypothetical protein